MPALRKKQRGILIRLHQKRAELKALQARHLAQPPPQSKTSLDASSVPTRSVTEVPSESFASGECRLPGSHTGTWVCFLLEC